MVKKVLTVKHLHNNVSNHCVPIALYVILKNQFEGDKRTNVLGIITLKLIKKWTQWGAESAKHGYKLTSGKDGRYYRDAFTGQFNIEDFHLELNQHIRGHNVTLTSQQGFTAQEIREKINSGVYPMFLVNPQYIEQAEQFTEIKHQLRGKPLDIHHFIVIHGYEDDDFFIYDSDLYHNPTEVLSEYNVKCKVPFGVLHRFSKDINNRLYWFELTDKSQVTQLMSRY